MHSFHHIAKPGSQNPLSPKSFFQPKLTINNPGDQYEKEANDMADKVMRMGQPFIQTKPLPITSVQRKCARCEEEKKAQRKELNGNEITDHSFESYISNINGSGQSLSNEIRNFYEPRFGYDFSDVKVHTDSIAAKSAQSINAQAYTSGNNIVFNSGQYSPNTDSGKRLLGHELTHVLQQNTSIKTKKIQRTIGDGHDLVALRFKGDGVLEACFDNERVLTTGAKGSAVSKIQQALVDAGFPLPKFGVDGDFGSETRTAVRNFQASLGLKIDGIVGPQTMGALDARFSSTPPAPTPPAPTPPAPTPPAPTPPAPTPPPTPPAPTPPAPTPPVAVNITGATELWHFNGATPPTYPLQQTLRGNAGGLPGTFRWSILGGAAIADFSGAPVAVGPTAILRSKLPSGALNDVQVRVDFTGTGGGTGAASIRTTVRAPQSMTPTGNVSSAITRGWRTLIGYSIQDQFGTTLPRNIEVNEIWDNKPPLPDFAGTNWPSFPPTEGHAFVNPSGWNDNVASPIDGIPPVLIPTPIAPGSGGPLVQHFRGHWQVGSPTIGGGRRVRTVTWRFFQDHGDHA